MLDALAEARARTGREVSVFAALSCVLSCDARERVMTLMRAQGLMRGPAVCPNIFY